MKTRSVLFVCLGNICRSPLAEGLVAKAASSPQFQSHDIRTDSAGTGSWHIGEAPHPKSQKTALGRGIDISSQRCRQIKAEDFSRFDLILAMDRSNLANIEHLTTASDGTAQIALFLDYAGLGHKDVPDPWGEPERSYEAVADMIENAAPEILKKLVLNA